MECWYTDGFVVFREWESNIGLKMKYATHIILKNDYPIHLHTSMSPGIGPTSKGLI